VYIAVTGAAGMVLTQGRHKKGLGKISSGILSLYDFVGFMSDVLSYSRLLALGLATAVVASVINTMGMLFGLNVFGVIVLVLVFIGGHLFNIAISTLGAYVHSSRLQYVEFFSKFYEGGGKPYKPFKYDTKYIEITNGGADDGILD
jgi:V/A-type H+-transporting ATPase subunit I